MQFDKFAEAVKTPVGALERIACRHIPDQRADQAFGQREEQGVMLLPVLLEQEHFARQPERAGGSFFGKGSDSALGQRGEQRV